MSEPSRRGRPGADPPLPLFDGPASPAAVPAAVSSGPDAAVPSDPDAEARAFAVDPRHNVVLEASAGTGKTSVLVTRYVNLLKAGIDPANILAITFTRKAAAEMRERIVRELRLAADRSEIDRARWLELRDRLGEIAISTIDAFCLSLLREFPLEADVDPAFDLADETEVPRLVATALDRAMRILVAQAQSDPDVALVLAQLGIARTREGLATLVDRRLVAGEALNRFLARAPRDLSAASVCGTAAAAMHDALLTVAGGLPQFLATGPGSHPRYGLLLRAMRALEALRQPDLAGEATEAAIRAVLDRVSSHFLTNDGTARKPGTAIQPYTGDHYPSKEAAKRHREALFQIAPRVEAVMFAFNRDLNVVLARGIRRMFAVALAEYRRALEERSVLDFSDVLERALELLRRMDEFSQSRFRLESRYHHVLVDEFQDTSRAQWELVSLLVQAWGEGLGAAANPSIFIVGDRKQSIYRFRDADVAVLQEAARYIDGLRPGSRARRSIARSFRAVPDLLHFVNDIFAEISQPARGADDFTYDERDWFPVDPPAGRPLEEPALGLAVAESADGCAAAVADEIGWLIGEATVRDKATGVWRPARAGDIAILFRSRSSHREFERELGARGIPTYVYKGLGFFDADEIKDLTALLRFLADPSSALRTAAFLRSRFIRLSDRALGALAPEFSASLLSPGDPAGAPLLDAEDRRVLEHARAHVHGWLGLVDRITPSALLDRILTDTAYAFELEGPRRRQAWENVKKMRGLVRRIQNRGYATVSRLADHLMALTAGDESNAVIEAIDAVNLMTVHASKGLEFPIVFVVNLAKGASAPPRPVRVSAGSSVDDDDLSVTVGPFLSATDESERDRERHETRRLLYVALTRARDRLYLSAALKDGALVAGRGSLAEVLPDSFRAMFARAAAVFAEADAVGWTGASGHEYSWRLCRAGAGTGTTEAARSDRPQNGATDDFAALADAASRTRLSVTEVVGSSQPLDVPAPSGPVEAARSEQLLGVIVHRLFEHGGLAASAPGGSDDGLSLASKVLRPDERAMLENPDRFLTAAAETWLRARHRPDVTAALDGVERLYEVPFAILDQDDGVERIVRGAIDCLVWKPGGDVAVVEFKTGRPSPAHRRQLDFYVRAAAALFPGVPVHGILLYL
jgi:ATP-dependent helicase/nuclease subunit A